ncbi:endonuclease/exonuclease/phosphatase family protein [Gordonia sp. (in: high G+C Gram-positive bacteria)]|uniref:endonuclease/exonuclease/phosphatase family protein n=1 Tax=Gordonia sp. (in: high G+C Gram-positive bacteria) TaxID=84139 RepID=UPI0039E53780
MIGKVFRIGGLVVGLLLLVVGVFAVVLHYLPSSSNLTIYPTSAVPLAVLTTAAAVLVFACLRRWILVGLAAIVVGALLFTQLPLWRSAPAPAASAPTITVLSSNLTMGGADVAELARLVADVKPDVVSLQEVTPEALTRVESSSITTALPNVYAVPGRGAVGTVLLSRGPLREQVTLPNMVLHNLGAVTDLPGAAGTHVLAVHSGAPIPGAGYGEIAVKDLGVLRGHVAALPAGRMIAVGDFNATWDHKHYRDLLTGGIADATDQAGAGWLPTYPTDRAIGPLVGIDHVISRGFVARDVRTYRLPGADHRVLVATLAPV